MTNSPSDPTKSGARPLRVTLLLDTVAWAGTESHVFTLARSLRAQNEAGDATLVEVSIATVPNSPLWDRARAAGIPTVAIARRGVWDADTLQTLARRVRRGACDVIHAHNGRTALWSALAIRAAGRGANVFTHHFIEPAHATKGGASGGAKGQIKKRVHTSLAAGIAGHIAISQAVADAIIERGEVAASRLTIVRNGIEAPAEVSAETDLPAALCAEIACVARLQKEKGLPTLVRAMKLLQTERPGNAPRCVIAGAGDERAALEALIREEGAGAVVHLAGFTPHVSAILRAARLSVLPSPAEPFGLAIVEAMAQGRAVVAVDAGGPREIVVPGETGLLVPPDDPAALARALAELLDNPARTAAMGRAGRARFEAHFTAARMARETIEVYQRALSGARS